MSDSIRAKVRVAGMWAQITGTTMIMGVAVKIGPDTADGAHMTVTAMLQRRLPIRRPI